MVEKDGNACLFRLALVILQPLKNREVFFYRRKARKDSSCKVSSLVKALSRR